MTASSKQLMKGPAVGIAALLLCMVCATPGATAAGLPQADPSARSAAVDKWSVTADGAVTTKESSGWYGDLAGRHLNEPVVGLAGTPTGRGYWLVASDGGVFAFGDARFAGSAGALKLNKPVVGMAPTQTGNGYWLVASDGGVFAYGDARFAGSAGSLRLNKPIVGIAATNDDAGYWLVASDGGVFAYGSAPFLGSGDVKSTRRYVSITALADGGYALLDALGTTSTFSRPAATPEQSPTGKAPLAAPAGKTWKVMPLGDSITQLQPSYRGYLYNSLVGAGAKVDFVGSVVDSMAFPVDAEHEGHSGWSITDMTPKAQSWVSTYKPDLILLHAGTNDLQLGATGAETADRLRRLLTEIYLGHPETSVSVASIIKFYKDPAFIPPTEDFRRLLPQVVEEFRAKGYSIAMADLSESVTREGLRDDLHPNFAGAQSMAAAWFPFVSQYVLAA